MTQSINFDEGYKTYEINGDPERVIRFNPSDPGILRRIVAAKSALSGMSEEVQRIRINADGSSVLEQEAGAVKIIEDKIKEQINYIFGADISSAAFGLQSPLATLKGVPLYERFCNALLPVLEKDIKSEAKASQKRVAKYTSQVAK